MAEIKVTPRELRNKADQLEQFNRQFRNEVKKMEGYESQLSSMWDGDAKQAFRKAFNDDKIKMERFALNIDKYIMALREDAQKYEEAEQKATNIATERKS